MAPLSAPFTPLAQTDEPFSSSQQHARCDTANSFDGDSSDMSPNVFAQGKSTDRVNQLANVFASLYDDDAKLQSPISLGNQYSILETPSENIVTNMRGQNEEVDTDRSSVDSMDTSAHMLFIPKKEWIGNSQFFEEANIELQEGDHLEMIRGLHDALLHDQLIAPYDPAIYIEFGAIFNKLSFCDVAVGNAHRALLLINAALGIKTAEVLPVGLGDLVKHTVAKKSSSFSVTCLADELHSMQYRAYIELLNGLLGCAAFWEGLAVSKATLKLWPNDADILELRNHLKAGFLDRNRGLMELGSKGNELVATTRCGQIYQKRYPWMNQELLFRTPALLREINKNFGTGKCEVRPVVFGSHRAPTTVEEGQDVGPCGVFAKGDIHRGEVILVDHSITGVSNVPSSALRHCDTCHAALFPPYMHPSQICKPSCCDRVAYCSPSCFVTATKTSGYHKILCKKDIDWVYENGAGPKGAKGSSSAWQGAMVLRVIAIILADMKKDPKIHPLQHPLLARMSANYVDLPAGMNQPENTHDWLYSESVIAPTRILLQLGVDIFNDPKGYWTQEVIQTMCWRLQNNANAAISQLLPNTPAISMVNINTQYLFLNHSCLPNLSWHGSIPTSDVGIEWVQNERGEVQRPGSSAVFCLASRDIKAGEELKISYVGDPMGDEKPKTSGKQSDIDARFMSRQGKRTWLEKWFDNGCGCEVCEKENEEERKNEKSGCVKMVSATEGESGEKWMEILWG